MGIVEAGKALKVGQEFLMTFLVNRGLRSACSGHQRDSRYPSVINNETQCIIVSKFLEPSQTQATVQNALPQAAQGHEGGNQVLGRVNRHNCTKLLLLSLLFRKAKIPFCSAAFPTLLGKNKWSLQTAILSVQI